MLMDVLLGNNLALKVYYYVVMHGRQCSYQTNSPTWFCVCQFA